MVVLVRIALLVLSVRLVRLVLRHSPFLRVYKRLWTPEVPKSLGPGVY